MDRELSAPYNWCDASCERCLLVKGCAVAQWQWQDPMEVLDLATAESPPADPGQHDDSLPAKGAPVQAAEGDRSLEDGPKRPEPSLAQTHWVRSGAECSMAVRAVTDTLGGAATRSQKKACDDARAAALLVACKCARIASYLTCDGSLEPTRASAADAAPNLLLVERSLADAAIAMALLSDKAEVSALNRFWSAHRELDRLLASTRDVREAAWQAVRSLIASGEAPSPFAVANDPNG